jgi:hypothetical protein
MSIIRSIKSSHINYQGKSFSDKLVVFESDDWGSIRTTTRSEYSQFDKISSGNPYLSYDTLAGASDLDSLYNTLRFFKDADRNHPVFTFNTVVANPDFDKIKASGYEKYFFEPFTETLEKYYPSQSIFKIWKEGINEGLVSTQFHGREHLNVPIWLKALKGGNEELQHLFNLGTWSASRGKVPNSLVKLQAALDYQGLRPVEYQNEFVCEGLDLFENIFGFRSKTMIANNYTWSPELHEILLGNGVELMQSMKYQVLPYGNHEKHKLERRYFGEKTGGMTFNIRNCVFEPSLSAPNFDDVSVCLAQMRNAFRFNKPAVIVSHRLNYIGEHDEKNRNQNINKLSELLRRALATWPDIRFTDSARILELIK